MELCITNSIPEFFFPETGMLIDQIQTNNDEETVQSNFEPIDTLFNKKLKETIYVKIEEDKNNYIASLDIMPIFGYGKTPKATIDSIKRQLESCYKELNESNEFSDDWLNFKRYLQKIIE
jgi:hypothetical protein